MAVTNYITIDGVLIGEMTNGLMRNYQLDALGSVVGTILNGVAENTYRYNPYGAVGRKTGSAADPSFLWNCGSGYRATSLANVSHYVRRRHYSDVAAQWTTRDPVWPNLRAYGYGGQSPAVMVDRTGLSAGQGASPTPGCACCAQAIDISATRFFGPGSGHTPTCTIGTGTASAFAMYYRGHNIAVSMGLDLISLGSSGCCPAPCLKVWTETTQYKNINGSWGQPVSLSTDFTVSGTLEYDAWAQCQSAQTSQTCGQGIDCEIPDSPAIAPIRNVNGPVVTNVGRKKTITVTISSSSSICPNPSVSATFLQDIQWTGTPGSEPTTWTPK